MKYRNIIILIVFLFSGCRNTNHDIPTSRKKTIVFFGSSVCRGSGDEMKLGYAGRFAQRLDTAAWNYVNISIGGDNTIRLTNRFDTCLRPLRPDYVVIGLSLSNEGISGPKTDEGRRRIMERFRTGVLRLADSIRSMGAVPIITNCYARNSFDENRYRLTCEMNAIINDWPFPSINLMGAVDNGSGGWVSGFEYNDGHPNGKGHEEMSRTVVPTLFDALEAGKGIPQRNWTSDYTQFFDMKSESAVLQVELDTLIHSFAESIMFRVAGEGLIGAVKHRDGISTISVKNGNVIYSSPAGTASVALPVDNLESWYYLTLSHCYARSETNLYLNGIAGQPVKERLSPTAFTIGGYVGNTTFLPDSLSVRDWMIHRSSLASYEVKNYIAWKMLASSLEVYAPLCNPVSGSNIENRAQSLTEVIMPENTTYKTVKIGMKKGL